MSNHIVNNNSKKRRTYQKPSVTLIHFEDLNGSEQYEKLIRETNDYSSNKKVPESPAPD